MWWWDSLSITHECDTAEPNTCAIPLTFCLLQKWSYHWLRKPILTSCGTQHEMWKKILSENLTDSLLECDRLLPYENTIPLTSYLSWDINVAPSNEKKAVLLTFCWSWNKMLWHCPAAKHCSVTHILLVMGWNMMRLLAANTVTASLTDCWYGMGCVKTARWNKQCHSPTIGHRIRCIGFAWHSITHMLFKGMG